MSKRIVFTLLLFVLAIHTGYGRFGGAGGDDDTEESSSSGGGSSDSWNDDDDDYSIDYDDDDYESSGSSGGDGKSGIYILYVVLGIVGMITLYVAISSGLDRRKRRKQRKQQEKEFLRSLRDILDFDPDKFLENASIAFYKLQESWKNQDLSRVRRFITDGLYQRSLAQFKMMKLLEQNNSIEKVKLNKIKIYGLSKDGDYDILHLYVNANIKDTFESKKIPELNVTYNETFEESWSFIRKRNSTHKDIYSSNHCPNCGDTVKEEMVDLIKCSSCGTIANNPEYDWILCEITQIKGEPEFFQEESYHKNLAEVENLNSLSTRLLEDKASNAFTQIRMGMLLKNERYRIHRFTTDGLFKKINQQSQPKYLLNRFYLTSCDLISVSSEGKNLEAEFTVHYREQKVEPKKDGSFVILYPKPIKLLASIKMIREKGHSDSRYDAVTGNCNHCGATLSSSTDEIKCGYCGNVTNDPSKDWIVSDIRFSGFKN